MVIWFLCVLIGFFLIVRYGSELVFNILDGDKLYKKDIKVVSFCEKWK